MEEPAPETTIVDVVVGSLGLTGAFLLAAIILGAMLGGILIGIKLMRPVQRRAGSRFRIAPDHPPLISRQFLTPLR